MRRVLEEGSQSLRWLPISEERVVEEHASMPVRSGSIQGERVRIGGMRAKKESSQPSTHTFFFIEVRSKSSCCHSSGCWQSSISCCRSCPWRPTPTGSAGP